MEFSALCGKELAKFYVVIPSLFHKRWKRFVGDKCRDVSHWRGLLPRSKLLRPQTLRLLSCWVTTAIWGLLLVLLGTRVWCELSRLFFFSNLTYVFGTPSMCQALF